MKPRCGVSVVLDFDSVGCYLEPGHSGMHEDIGDGGVIRWEIVETFG